MGSCSVLVIGGSGFLGQHVISLLQSRAPFVTEIRTLDIVPYENKLEHEERVPVQVFTGSVTDGRLVEEACQGVNIVVHLATVIDLTMFPDVAKTMQVNVEGPSVVVKVAADSPSVFGFIFSSSVAVHFGKGCRGTGLTEDSPIPEQRYYEPYATSKLQAEQLVLAANGPWLSTTVIRPSIMYGELDYARQYTMDVAANLGGWISELKSNNSRHQQAYVGNVAWGFVCAVKKINEKRTSQQQQGDTGSLRKPSRDISGEVFIIADDTEPINTLAQERCLLEAAGLRYLWGKFPLPLLILIIHVIFIFLNIFSWFGVKPNFPFSTSIMGFFYQEYVFSDKKANDLLGYTPVFGIADAKRRSIEYYRKRWADTTNSR